MIPFQAAPQLPPSNLRRPTSARLASTRLASARTAPPHFLLLFFRCNVHT